MTEQFQLFPVLDAATEAALRASIERWGVLVPVVKDQHGSILDGYHRARIADELGIDYPTTTLTLNSDADRFEIARTLNADRRHMDRDQRIAVEADLRENGHSLRAIAGAVGVSEAQVHRDLSTVTDVTVPDRVTGLDGKSRPATRPAPTPTSDADLEKLSRWQEMADQEPSPRPQVSQATQALLHALTDIEIAQRLLSDSDNVDDLITDLRRALEEFHADQP